MAVTRLAQQRQGDAKRGQSQLSKGKAMIDAEGHRKGSAAIGDAILGMARARHGNA